MKIKQKLIVALGSLSVVILVLGLFTTTMLDRLAAQNTIFSQLSNADSRLLQARLSQADYMLLEEKKFREGVDTFLQQANEELTNAKAAMAVEQSITQVNDIQSNINIYQSAFKAFTQAKQKDIEGRKSFSDKAKVVSNNIEAVLLSIETYFTANPEDFEEFNRYLAGNQFKDNFNELRVAVWQYNQRSGQSHQNSISRRINDLEKAIPSLQKIMLSDETQTLLIELQGALTRYKSLNLSMGSARKQLGESVKIMLKEANQASIRTEKLIVVESQISNQVRAQVKQAIIIAVMLAIALSVGLAVWLIKLIMTPLNQSIHFAQDIAKGDLTSTIVITGDDEFAVLNKAFNESANVLQTTMSEIKDAVTSLSQGSAHIDEVINKTNQSAQEQANENDQLVNAVNETMSATNDIAASASDASQKSTQATEEAKSGNQIVADSSKAMDELATEMNTASSYVEKLHTDSANINQILNVIRGIAEQTNLLALNAAIEAARAGEQGRGFAVVADEVRTLAQKTQGSIEEITQIIDLIQLGANNVVSVMETSTLKTQQVLTLTEDASAAYINISGSIDAISQLNCQVSVASEQQAHVATDMNGNVTRIKSLADINEENLCNITEQVSLQKTKLEQVNKLVQFFKV
ncbi:methyl-accepting chemotaxis protein [Psychromonas sp. Urea-02u-13]|uniref:methyl-accepting chemotaxis protein n=1 Tax=Psychromonas sp. Urea-02u-13 TaxID=2058326 RepID=UPI000C31E0F5|nr:methyl-accepting chemotaxis protein [Psychromonas sp. Urea-02u-13]PKG38105.1 hypothetical protein CXF74_15255 [Psychromonas sp. Urea-02u-13]